MVISRGFSPQVL